MRDGVPEKAISPEFLRAQMLGADATIATPFGRRPMVYADYTASGQPLYFVERYLANLARRYANTHTEDDATGRLMSRLMHDARREIKRAVNAGPHGCVVACGTGATGAIDHFQHILGVALSPATRSRVLSLLQEHLGEAEVERVTAMLDRHKPVVFIGPYEHHSNEVSWRQSLATVETVRLDDAGHIDLAHLESLLEKPEYQGRLRIGSFSAASNVTGIKSDVHAIAALLHRHGALACFDFAASAPYVKIDMNPADDGHGGAGYLDAVYFSPHKFIGGPGSCGLLVFNARTYRRDLPPSISGGGTVDYVSPSAVDYIRDIETRETAGTPGILQFLRASLAVQIRERVGQERIERRELDYMQRAFSRWRRNPNIEIIGDEDPRRRVGIVSLSLRDPRGGFLHPKFVTTLLNDLFGIQTRAGCFCAGPYGHRLLGIDEPTSGEYLEQIQCGYESIKPGWCRLSFHYAMSDEDVDYLIDAVDFVAGRGHLFTRLYRLDVTSGAWTHRDFVPPDDGLSLEDAAACAGRTWTAPKRHGRIGRVYGRMLRKAGRLADALAAQPEPEPTVMPSPELEHLRFFTVSACNLEEPGNAGATPPAAKGTDRRRESHTTEP